LRTIKWKRDFFFFWINANRLMTWNWPIPSPVHSPAVSFLFYVISLSLLSLWGFLFCAVLIYTYAAAAHRYFTCSPLGRDQVDGMLKIYTWIQEK
jgi:hypothetical protein